MAATAVQCGFLPTTGPVMVNDIFGHLTGGSPISQPSDLGSAHGFACLAHASAHTAAAIMLSGGEVMEGFGLTHIAGVFDARMIRIYRMIGSSPLLMFWGLKEGDAIRFQLLACGLIRLKRLQQGGRPGAASRARSVAAVVQHGLRQCGAA